MLKNPLIYKFSLERAPVCLDFLHKLHIHY
ncbi:hypothetical protein SBV1_1240009 [Verrucomicrobia bacterium]|nr:hypothetical protein SBV1_1240009 [Verrucomicrobiota bacterium]